MYQGSTSTLYSSQVQVMIKSYQEDYNVKEISPSLPSL